MAPVRGRQVIRTMLSFPTEESDLTTLDAVNANVVRIQRNRSTRSLRKGNRLLA